MKLRLDGVGSVLDVHVEHVHAQRAGGPQLPKEPPGLARSSARAHVLSTGRYGNWEYSAMEDALIQGCKAAACSASDWNLFVAAHRHRQLAHIAQNLGTRRINLMLQVASR